MQAGQNEDISQVVANFDAIATILNGGLEPVNLKGQPALQAQECAVWDGVSAFARSSSMKLTPASIGTGTPDATKYWRGDGAWTLFPTIPPTPGMVQLSDTVLGASAASIDITGISQAYQMLKVYTSFRIDVAIASATAICRCNNDSGANYSEAMMQAAASVGGGEVNSATSFSTYMFGALGTIAPANFYWEQETTVHNYSRTDRAKNLLGSAAIPQGMGTANHIVRTVAGIWNNTAALNRLTFSLASGNFVAGSRVMIYGLL